MCYCTPRARTPVCDNRRCIELASSRRKLLTEPQNYKWVPLLKHTVGGGDDVAPNSRGYRNRYCAAKDSWQDVEFKNMVDAGLVCIGKVQAKNTFYHATRAGCKMAGLDAAQTERAMEE